jgi:hypothetical protein
MIEFLSRAVLIGFGATALLDLWALLLQRFFRVPAPNWGLVGRWFCHLTKAKSSTTTSRSRGPILALLQQLQRGIANAVERVIQAARPKR